MFYNRTHFPGKVAYSTIEFITCLSVDFLFGGLVIYGVCAQTQKVAQNWVFFKTRDLSSSTNNMNSQMYLCHKYQGNIEVTIRNVAQFTFLSILAIG